MKSAFEKFCKEVVQDAINAATAELMEKPYISKIIWPDQVIYTLECLEDHTRYIDAGIGGISVPMKKGDTLETQDLSIHSLDISKFKILRTEIRKI